jgi:tetratricopeptide (TPR) repeat protein
MMSSALSVTTGDTLYIRWGIVMPSLIRMIPLMALCLITLLVVACAGSRLDTGYRKISFCWSSEHAMSPSARQISIESTEDEVIRRIEWWVKQNKGGQILERNDNFKTLMISADADAFYTEAKSIAENEWRAYDNNTYREWKEDEWQAFVELMRKQTEVRKTGKPARYLKAKLNRREVRYAYTVQKGTTSRPMYMPSFKIYSATSGGFRTTTIPGAIVPVPMDNYQKQIDRISFYSILEVYISKNGSSGITVYAKSTPIDESTFIVADYGNSIDYAFWEAIKPTIEAKLVEELLAFLKTGKPLPVVTNARVESTAYVSGKAAKAQELLKRGDALLRRRRNQEAIEAYTMVIEMPDAPAAQKAQAYQIRSVIYGMRKKYDRSIADCTAIIDMPDAPIKRKADAYYFRAVAYSSIGKHKNAKYDCAQTMSMPSTSDDQKSRALKFCSEIMRLSNTDR